MRLCNDGDNDAYDTVQYTNTDAIGIIILTIVVDLYNDIYYIL